MNEKEKLHQERRAKLAQMRAVLDKAKADKRGLTADEDRTYQALKVEVLDINAQLDAFAPETQRIAPVDGHVRTGLYQNREQRAALFQSAEVRAMQASLIAQGGAMVPSELAQFVVDGLAAEAVAFRAGVQQFPTSRATFELPKMAGDPAGGWYAETEEIDASDSATGVIVAADKKFATRIEISNELLTFSQPTILDLLFQRVTRSAALGLDLGIFEGTGFSNQVRGIRDRTGIESVSMGTNGAAFTNLDPFADAIGQLAENNAAANAIVMHPRSWLALSKLKEVTGASNKPLLQESAGSGSQGIERRIYGLPVFLSSQLSITETQGSATNASSAYLAQWDQGLLVTMDTMRIDLNRSRLFHKDMSEIRLTMHVDFAVLNESAFCRIKGIIP